MTRHFAYRAYTPEGRVASGVLPAASELQALDRLARLGLVAFETREAGSSQPKTSDPSGCRNIGAAELNLTLRGIATLLDAGIPIDAALRLASEQAGTPRQKQALARLHEDMVAGKPLSEAMAQQPTVFSASHAAIARAGETTGSLAPALRDLCQSLERDAGLNGRLRSAFIYPGILLAVSFFAIVLIFLIMVPAITPLFEGQSKPLPFVLAFARGAGGFLQNYWLPLTILSTALLLAAGSALRSERIRQGFRERLLRAPLIAPLSRDAAASRFARTLAMMLRGGAGLPQALSVTASAMKGRAERDQIIAALDAVRRGARLADGLSRFQPLTSASRGLLQIGEQSNRLPEMLMHIAALHEADLDRKIERLMTLLTPLLTVVIGLVVGAIILSVMNAVLSANDLAM